MTETFFIGKNNMKHWSDEAFISIKKEGFKYAFRCHTPGYCDVDSPNAPVGFNKLEELWELPYVKVWNGPPSNHKVMILRDSPYDKNQWLVIASKWDDEKRYVIGYFSDLVNSYNGEAI